MFGGGNEGNINGSPEVVVVPDTHTLSVGLPSGGSIKVRNTLNSSYNIGENVEVPIVAVPASTTSSGGYAFNHWTYSGTGACVGNVNSPVSTFTMGTGIANLSAVFDHVQAYTLTVENPDDGGTITVDGTAYTAPVWVALYASATVVATPAEGYVFTGWTVEGTGATVINTLSPATIFKMGTANATLTAHFEFVGETNNDGN